MRRRAIIGALLFVTVGVVLGATVFRTGIAQATGRSKSVRQAGVTGGSNAFALACPNTNSLGFKVTASGLAIHMSAGVAFFALKMASSPGFGFSTIGPANGGPADIALSFPKAVSFDVMQCTGVGTVAGGTVGNGSK